MLFITVKKTLLSWRRGVTNFDIAVSVTVPKNFTVTVPMTVTISSEH
jgi:hypothetical protein